MPQFICLFVDMLVLWYCHNDIYPQGGVGKPQVGKIFLSFEQYLKKKKKPKTKKIKKYKSWARKKL